MMSIFPENYGTLPPVILKWLTDFKKPIVQRVVILTLQYIDPAIVGEYMDLL